MIRFPSQRCRHFKARHALQNFVKYTSQSGTGRHFQPCPIFEVNRGAYSKVYNGDQRKVALSAHMQDFYSDKHASLLDRGVNYSR